MIRDDAFHSRARCEVDETIRSTRRSQWEPVLSAEEERELATRIKAGDQAARRQLILANLRIVVHIARRYRCFHVPMDDLIQDGNLGLIRASADFDPSTHKCRFFTYAAVWIRAFIRRALVAHTSIIRIPNHAYWRHRTHPTVTAAEAENSAAEDFDLETESIPPRHLAPASSENSIDPASLLETIADPRRPDQEIAERERRLLLERALRRLSPVEAWILRERYGLAPRGTDKERWESLQPPSDQSDRHKDAVDDPPTNPAASGRSYFHRTYVELHRDCGLSFYRIRQIEATALEKLREALTP